MDWSKAKTILIIALLITSMVLGGVYAGRCIKENRQLKAEVGSTVLYAQKRGAVISCELPWASQKLPVLFVTLNRTENAEIHTYKDIPVEAGDGFPAEIVPKNEGEARGRLKSASSALIELLGKIPPEGLEIQGVELVYWLDPSYADASATEDTAIPAWKLTTGSGVYYIEAFAN